jgi:hypothetical protein
LTYGVIWGKINTVIKQEKSKKIMVTSSIQRPSTLLKKAIKKAFPWAEFTFEVHKGNVEVSWLMDIGSGVTLDAMNQFYEEYKEQSEDRCFLFPRPEFTTERKIWSNEIANKITELKERNLYTKYLAHGVVCWLPGIFDL